MIREPAELIHTQVDFQQAEMGKGRLELIHILNAPEELIGAGRIFAYASLPAEAWVEEHTHQGEREIYYYVKGYGEYNDNGKVREVGPGFMTQVRPGQYHGLRNIGDCPLEYICLVLYETGEGQK